MKCHYFTNYFNGFIMRLNIAYVKFKVYDVISKANIVEHESDKFGKIE